MLSEGDTLTTEEEGRRWREQSSHLAQNQDIKNKINGQVDVKKKKPLIAYTGSLGSRLVNKNWNGSFMSVNLSFLALPRFDWVTGMWKSLTVIFLKKDEEQRKSGK